MVGLRDVAFFMEDLENSIDQQLSDALESNFGDDATIVAYRH